MSGGIGCYKNCSHHYVTFGERTSGYLEQVSENTEHGSAPAFSLTFHTRWLRWIFLPSEHFFFKNETFKGLGLPLNNSFSL